MNPIGPVRRRRRRRLRNAIETKPERIFDGFTYHYGRSLAGGARRMLCSKRNSHGCSAQRTLSVLDDFSLDVPNKNRHTHARDPNAENIARFEMDLYQATRRQFRKLSLIYPDVAIMHDEAAELRPFQLIRNKMESWRSNMRLPMTITLDLFYNDLQTQEYQFITRHDHGKVDVKFLRNAENGFDSIILFDQYIIDTISTEKLYFESSKVVPEDSDAVQTTVIASLHADHVIPIFFIFFIVKTDETWTRTLSEVKRLVNNRQDPIKIYTEFDTDLDSAISVVYPGVETKKTLISQCKVLVNTAAQFNVNLENEATLLIFAKIVALTLLPAHDIVETYYWIVESMNDAQLREFRDFIDNYYEVWLNNITPSKYSCYNDQLQLIKNKELILKNMVHSLRQKKIWDFLEYIVKSFGQSHFHLGKLLRDGQMNFIRNKMKNLFTGQKNFSMMMSDWRATNIGVMSKELFLRRIGTSLRTVLGDLIISGIDLPSTLKLPSVPDSPEPGIRLVEINRQPRAELLDEAGPEKIRQRFRGVPEEPMEEVRLEIMEEEELEDYRLDEQPEDEQAEDEQPSEDEQPEDEQPEDEQPEDEPVPQLAEVHSSEHPPVEQ